tara:strand:- start:693 stop:2150 length:1458 start_codon:yes stop_codon:yes gene_type:complete
MSWKATEKRWIKRIPKGYPDAGKMVQAGKRKLQYLYPETFINATRSGSREAANLFWQDFIEQHNQSKALYDSAIRQRQVILEAEKIRREGFETNYNINHSLIPATMLAVDRLQLMPDESQKLKQQIALLEEQKTSGMAFESTEIELPDLPTLPVLFPNKKAKEVREQSKKDLSFLIAENITRLEKRTLLDNTNKKSLSIGGFGNRKRYLNSILTGLGDMHIDQLNEAEVTKYNEFVNDKSVVEKTKIDFWVYFKEFVQGCCDDGIKQKIPLNLHKKEYNFSPDQKTPDPATIKESKYVLRICKEKNQPLLELSVLLHLNCGMTSKDIALLQKCDVDLKNATLTYKRSKAVKHEQITKVTYPLWKRTVELLKLLESDSNDYWLLNSRDTNYMIGEDGKRKDGIGKNFSRFKTDNLPQFKKALKDFRKTGCTELEELGHPDKITKQFLQQSADDTKGRSYSGRMRTPFTDAIDGLEKVFEVKEKQKK